MLAACPDRVTLVWEIVQSRMQNPQSHSPGWMGEQGQQQVQQHFLWDFLAKRTEEVYLSLLGLEEHQASAEFAASQGQIEDP